MGQFGSKSTSNSPIAMKAPTDLTVALSQGAQLVIKQKRELTEIFLGFETTNKYMLFDSDGGE